MNKKVLIILGSILGLIIIVVAIIFFVVLKSKSATPATQNSNTASNSSGSATNSVSGQPVKLTTNTAVSPVLSYDNTLIWYFSGNGNLYTVNLSTGINQEYVLPNTYTVSNVIWPAVGNDFIVESDNSAGKSFYYYNSQNKNFIPYPSNVKEVSFMPDGKHVAYQWADSTTGKTTLSIANFDLTSHQQVIALPDSDDIIKVSPLRNRAFYYKNNAPADGKIYYVNLDSGKTFSIKTAASNLVAWSPDSSHFVYTKLGTDNDASSAQLWLGDLDSNTDKPLGLNIPVTKAGFDNTGKNLLLAQPSSGSSTGDTFLMLNVQSLQKTQIYSGGNYNATNLMLGNSSKNLYFLNSDGFIYSLPVTH